MCSVGEKPGIRIDGFRKPWSSSSGGKIQPLETDSNIRPATFALQS